MHVSIDEAKQLVLNEGYLTIMDCATPGAYVVGFDYFVDAETLAEKIGSKILMVHWQNGWNRAEEVDVATRPVTAEEYMSASGMTREEGYALQDKMDLDYILYTLSDLTIGFGLTGNFDFAAIKEFIKAMEELEYEINSCPKDSCVITRHGKYQETISKELMSYSTGQDNYAIAVLISNEEHP